MKNCQICGAECDDSVTFCTACGASFEGTAASAETVNPYEAGTQYAGPSYDGFDTNAPDVPHGPIEAARICFKKAFTISGRASRSEYWYFQLFAFLSNIALALCLVVIAALASTLSSSVESRSVISAVAGVLRSVWALVLFFPQFCVFVRRLHDTNRSGWKLLTVPLVTIGIIFVVTVVLVAIAALSSQGAAVVQPFAPLLGGVAYIGMAIYFFVLTCTRGTKGPNRFGPEPVRRF